MMVQMRYLVLLILPLAVIAESMQDSVYPSLLKPVILNDILEENRENSRIEEQTENMQQVDFLSDEEVETEKTSPFFPSSSTVQTTLEELNTTVSPMIDETETTTPFLPSSFTVQITLEELNTTVSPKIDESDESGKVDCAAWRDKLGYLSLVRGHYYDITNPKTWYDANTFCDNHGLKLAVIPSLSQLKTVQHNAPSRRDGYWVGAIYKKPTPVVFNWSDGRPVDDDLWNKENAQPDQYQDYCAHTFPNDGKLYDSPCSWVKYFVCQVGEEYSECL